MQEFAPRKESSTASPSGHWPSDAELAAYIDGNLGKAERRKMEEHLADCEECFAVYMGTLQFQSEEGNVIPFPARRAHKEWWWAAAAAVLLVGLIGGGWYAFQNAFLGPAPKMAVAQVTPPVQGRPVAALLWDHNRFRGEGEEKSALDFTPESFQIGALLVDFRISAQAKDVANASETWRSIGRVVGSTGFMAEDSDRILARATQIRDVDSLGRLSVRAYMTEKSLGESVFTPEYLDFGKWTEAGRVAAAVGNPAFFKERKNRRFLAYSLRNKEIKPPPEVRQRLEGIAEIWDRGNLGSAEFARLEQLFQGILDQYDFTS